MTVAQLLSSVSSREITEWQEYFALVDAESRSASARGMPV